ncbi:putative sugar nucleotidyl transferase [Hymenobacter cellulosilyticus]|uniref:putative sugar nucleotidyl transferase n=1 Tax=Hymenobacter cellulosilyticus TaxID=2932248 RepID=UPI002880BBA2|nr:putative sugar nucleotidyl transferase [Hymenobacter cellulosilyticus]
MGASPSYQRAVCPDELLAKQVQALQPGEALMDGNLLVAAHLAEARNVAELIQDGFSNTREVAEPVLALREVWHLFLHNGAEIRRDFALLTHGRQSQPVGDAHTIVYAPRTSLLKRVSRFGRLF